MNPKKSYLHGFLFLIAACFVMQLFAKSAEKVRLLYYILEWVGLYNGYRISASTVVIWIILTIAIIILICIAFHFMKSAYSMRDMKKRLKVMPFILLFGCIINCFNFFHIHRLLLRLPSGLQGIILYERDNVSYAGIYDESGNLTDISLNFEFQKFSAGDGTFSVKLVDLNDNSKEYIFPYSIKTTEALTVREHGGTYTCSVASLGIDIENIPGYHPAKKDYHNLRYKLIIFNENESKTFFLYFDKFKTR